jgi:MOSC domain-containing protein YiiM
MTPAHQPLRTSPLSGRILWIGVRPSRTAPLKIQTEVELDPNHGLVGDHYAGKTQRKRQVTLIQHEHLAVIEALLQRPVTPELLRRNLMVAGINLRALKGDLFQLGSALLKGTGFCHPCSRMEEALGTGGLHAMLGHGGITAEIVRGGVIRLGDEVRLAQSDLFLERLDKVLPRAHPALRKPRTDTQT